MNTMRTSEVLDLAADEIQRRGWTQGGGWRQGGALCLEGGIMAAAGLWDFTHDLWECPAYNAVAEYLGHDVRLETPKGSDVPGPRQPLWRFNDANGRTAEEVIEVLRAAAAVERTKEVYEDTDQPLPVEIPEAAVA